jgi:DNA invertase Pin-like site-specific DNA recombinase
MSTEHQQYSTDNQQDAIREYAERRGYEIVCTYADEGKSGLNVAGREQLRRLIDDVQCGRAKFKAILVYDVSRWGRFLDADAHRLDNVPRARLAELRLGDLTRPGGVRGPD